MLILKKDISDYFVKKGIGWKLTNCSIQGR